MQPTDFPDHELLRRWISGELTAPQEAELERRARTDPALREALDSLQNEPEADHATALDRMLSRSRPVAVRRRLAPRLAVAASLLVLIAFAAFLLPRYLSDPPPSIAMEGVRVQEPEDTRTTPPPSAPALPPPPAPQAKELSGRQSAEAGSPESAAQAEPESMAEVIVTDTATQEMDARLANRSASTSNRVPTPPPPAPILDLPPTEPQPSVRSRTAAAAARRRPAQVIVGRVSSEDGTPIGQAEIRRTGQPMGTVTDTSGAFVLPYDATLNQLVVSYPGYEDETVDVFDTSALLQISLTKIVESAARESWRENADRALLGLPPSPIVRPEALPAEGYRELRARIEDNRPDSLAAGRFRVSFLVDADGSLSDFRFRGTDDPAVMDYVGNTLVETSAWQVVQGEAPVRVYFTLRFE